MQELSSQQVSLVHGGFDSLDYYTLRGEEIGLVLGAASAYVFTPIILMPIGLAVGMTAGCIAGHYAGLLYGHLEPVVELAFFTT